MRINPSRRTLYLPPVEPILISLAWGSNFVIWAIVIGLLL